MSIFPITPLVLRVKRSILDAFNVSEQQAENYAAEMVALAEGWGSLEKAEQLDWEYRIRKDLDESRKLKWRSKDDQARFEAIERQKYADWDAFIRSGKRF